jgi:hypothetical protein
MARLLVAGAFVFVLAFAGPSQVRASGTQTMNVTFNANSTVSVTLPDGTAVGTSTGSPTVIPAGYYGINMLGPGGCIQQPLFHLAGPGEELINNMSGGEVTSEFYNAYFAPNSTYTWRLDTVSPVVVYTFVTNSTVGGTPPSSSPGGGNAGPPTSDNIVGSDVAPFRGELTGGINASGRLSLAFKGKSVAHLKTGRYTIVVADASASSGFELQKAGKKNVVIVTGARFTGKHSLTVDLTAGSWTFMSRSSTPVLRISVT